MWQKHKHKNNFKNKASDFIGNDYEKTDGKLVMDIIK